MPLSHYSLQNFEVQHLIKLEWKAVDIEISKESLQYAKDVTVTLLIMKFMHCCAVQNFKMKEVN